MEIINARIFVRPTEKSQIILDPNTGRPIDENGSLVLNDKYWRRRIADGSVKEVEMPEDKTNKTGRR